jgi:hypothetical protein
MARESLRYWLTFTADRNANVTKEVSIIALELTGEAKIIEAAVKWFRRKGVQVDPIELDIIES